MFSPFLDRRSFLAAGCAAFAGNLYAVKEVELPKRLGVPARIEPLPFEIDALEPYLDAKTLKQHREVHHAQILEKLRQTLKGMRLEDSNVATLLPVMRNIVLPPDPNRRVVRMGGGPPETPTLEMQAELRLHGGAHVNHTAFWRFLAPPGSQPGGPEGKLAKALDYEFGTFESFKAAFTEAAMRHVGAGWAFLVHRPDGKLVITTMNGEDNPLMYEVVRPQQQGRFILCLDLWEHAYFLKYGYDRRKYIEAWWNVVNWSFVAQAYAIVTTYQ